MFWPFSIIKKWATAGTEYRDSLSGLIEYLPVGDLDILAYWVRTWIPYKKDLDSNGKFDKLQNYNGADLTIKAKCGDCESKAAIFSEVIRAWKGWSSTHIYMLFSDGTAHDVAWFETPDGRTGWIDGIVYYGNDKDMDAHFCKMYSPITIKYRVNDTGDRY